MEFENCVSMELIWNMEFDTLCHLILISTLNGLVFGAIYHFQCLNIQTKPLGHWEIQEDSI